jgi:phosphoglycolate phosphatase
VDRFMDGFHNLPLIQDMKTVLLKLHEEKVMQSILSATDQANLNSMILHFELDDIFHHVCGVNNKLAGSKVESGFALIKKSGVPKEKTVIIGDTLHDLEVAKELGIDAVLIFNIHPCCGNGARC